MRAETAAVIAAGVLVAAMATAWAQTPTTTEKRPSGTQAAGVKVRGTVEATRVTLLMR